MSSPSLPGSASSANGDLSGRRLGDFQLLRRLGRGAMAEVYLAEQASLRRQVAVKVLKPELASDETYVKRFHNEAQAAAALVHANIVQIHDVGCHDGIHYIAQEYVQGQNLRERLARHGTPEAGVAVDIIRQVALALQKGAERGIVHRDIKPENIMISRSGEVKVADFGLARIAGGGADLHLTQVGVTMGTPLYMSPEQVEGRALDIRSDIYSLGVTCYHMLTGSPPFGGETALSVAVQHLKTEPRALVELRPDLPPALCRLVHRMLAKDPEQRFASPRELLQALRATGIPGMDGEGWAADESGAAALGASTVGASAATQQLAALMRTQSLAEHRERHGRRWLVLGVLASFALGAGAAWWLRPPSLLADAQPPPVPQQESARAQFFMAQLQPTDQEAWFESVERYFAADRYYVLRAKQELARLYLQRNQLEAALRLFNELAAMDVSEPESRAFGLAGQSIVFTIRGQHADAARTLAQVVPLRDKLDPRMGRLLLYPLSVNRRLMDQRTAAEWDEWQKNLPSEESFTPLGPDS